jgi:MFS family permease
VSAPGGQLRESLTALRGVFENRELRNVQLAFGGSVTATYAYSIALAVFAYRHGGATAVGVLAFARLATGAAIAPFAASLADRHRRERVMLASDLIRVVLLVTMTVAAGLGWPTAVIYVLAVASTAVATMFRPAESALLPTIVHSPEELTAANVSSSTIDSVGSFVGPALGAGLLALDGPALVFGLTAAACLWSAALVARISAPKPAEVVDPSTEVEEHRGLLAGVRAIRREPRLQLLIGLYGAQLMVAGASGVLIVVVALQMLQLGSAGVGLLEAVSGIGSIVGAAAMLALVTRNRLGANLGVGIVLWGAPLAVVGLATNTGVAIAAWLTLGLGNTLVDVSAMTLIQRATPSAVAARVFGVLESVFVGGLAVGALVAPLLVATAGPRAALIAVGTLLPVLAVLSWRQLRAVDAGAGVDEARVAALRTVPFLAPLPLQTIELLGSQVEPVVLAAGATLFRRGDHGDRFYVLTQGALDVELPDGTKREAAPASVGEIALLHDVPRTATVVAAADSELLALGRDDFLAAVTGHAASRGIAQDLAAARVGIVAGPA